MGMGEPFYNFDNIKKSVVILKNENGLNFSNKKLQYPLQEFHQTSGELQKKLELI